MQKAVSTFIHVKERLHPGILDGLHRIGAQAIEIFAARQHIDYANRKQHVREIAESMLANGQETPILVRRDGARFVLVEGLHRLEAAKALGETT